MLDDNISTEDRIMTMLSMYQYNKGDIILYEIQLRGELPDNEKQAFTEALKQRKATVLTTEALVNALMKDERNLITWKYLDEPPRTNKEIIAELQVCEKTFRKMLQNAVKEMARRLNMLHDKT